MKLTINTTLNRVFLIGTFCNWDLEQAKEVKKRKGNKSIVVNNMPACEYKVLNCRSWLGEEKPVSANRLFTGDRDEVITVQF